MTTSTPTGPAWSRIGSAVTHAVRPHSHDSADSVDDALEARTQGIRALRISLVALAVTAALQLLVVAVTGRWSCSPTPCTTSPTR